VKGQKLRKKLRLVVRRTKAQRPIKPIFISSLTWAPRGFALSALGSILRKEAISSACRTHELMDTDFVGNVTRGIAVLDDDDLTFSQILCQPSIESGIYGRVLQVLRRIFLNFITPV
jgi:hypothetical protein